MPLTRYAAASFARSGGCDYYTSGGAVRTALNAPFPTGLVASTRRSVNRP